jgi:hypothetical protein
MKPEMENWIFVVLPAAVFSVYGWSYSFFCWKKGKRIPAIFLGVLGILCIACAAASIYI